MDDDFERTDTMLHVTKDEVPRDTSLEALAGLKSVAREDGVHTAGTSSQIADGAAAVRKHKERLVVRRERLHEGQNRKREVPRALRHLHAVRDERPAL